MKYIIGLTGPTGSGKSSFAALAEQNGISVIDCDKVSRKVTESGSECLLKLAEAFGNDIIKDGVLDRKLLASRAFGSPEKKALLEEIIFPFILDSVLNKINNAKSNTVLLDAPTLYESGINELCGSVVAVLSDGEIRKQRIIKRDSLTEEQAALRMSAGKPDNFYLERADYIVYNNSDEAEFLRLSREIINTLIGGNKDE